MDSSILMILVPIGLILFALYRLWKFIQLIRKNSQSQTWQVTSAEILSKHIEKNRSTRSGVSYFPVIEYRYTVMGQSYEKKINLPKSYSFEKAEETANQLGTNLEIRYDPNQPKEHISKYEKANYFEVFLIVVILAVAVIIMLPYINK